MQDFIKLPSSYDAECQVIAALLTYPEITDEILVRINENDFYDKRNKLIMKAIMTLDKNGKIIDPVGVIDELERNDELNAIGGNQMIYSIMASLPSRVNYESYVDLVVEKSEERRLFEVASKIREDILNGTFTHDDLMINSENRLSELLKTQSKNEEIVRIDRITESVIQTIEENKAKDGHLVGIDTGYSKLNDMTNGLKPGELVILAARPAVGKSTFALNIARNACMKGKNVAVFSLEMGSDQLTMRLFSTFSGVDLKKVVSGDVDETEFGLILSAKNRLDTLGLYINQSLSSNLRDIRLACQKLHYEGKLDMVVIDYLQLLSSGSKAFGTRTEEVGRISRGLKEMARQFNIPVLALSQLSRNIEQTSRADKSPQLSDLRESGNIEQDADIVIFLHRESNKKDDSDPDTVKIVKSAKTQVKIAKNRQGITGDFYLTFKGATSEFVEYTGKDQD